MPTRFLINQYQIITFLILKSDIIENSLIELRGIVLPVPSNQIKVTFIIILPFNLVRFWFFPVSNGNWRKSWVDYWGAKGYVAPPLPIIGSSVPPPPPPPRPPSSYSYAIVWEWQISFLVWKKKRCTFKYRKILTSSNNPYLLRIWYRFRRICYIDRFWGEGICQLVRNQNRKVFCYFFALTLKKIDDYRKKKL